MTESLEQANTAAALEFLRQVASGTIDDAILAPDFTGWTGAFGEVSGDDFRRGVTVLTTVLKEPLTTTPIAVTAQGERVAVEAVSQGILKNGEHYSNDYHFLIIVRNGLINKVKAYFNTKKASDVLTALFNNSDPEYLDRVSKAAAAAEAAKSA